MRFADLTGADNILGGDVGVDGGVVDGRREG